MGNIHKKELCRSKKEQQNNMLSLRAWRNWGKEQEMAQVTMGKERGREESGFAPLFKTGKRGEMDQLKWLLLLFFSYRRVFDTSWPIPSF